MLPFWIKSGFALFLVGLLGARISKGINLGELLPYWYVIVSIMSGCVWVWMTRAKVNLIYASMFYDAIYATSYLIGFWLLGESITYVQLVGIVLAIVGVALIGM